MAWCIAGPLWEWVVYLDSACHYAGGEEGSGNSWFSFCMPCICHVSICGQRHYGTHDFHQVNGTRRLWNWGCTVLSFFNPFMPAGYQRKAKARSLVTLGKACGQEHHLNKGPLGEWHTGPNSLKKMHTSCLYACHLSRINEFQLVMQCMGSGGRW